MDTRSLVDIAAVIAIIGIVVVTDRLLLGIVALLLLRILGVLIDIRASLDQQAGRSGSS